MKIKHLIATSLIFALCCGAVAGCGENTENSFSSASDSSNSELTNDNYSSEISSSDIGLDSDLNEYSSYDSLAPLSSKILAPKNVKEIVKTYFPDSNIEYHADSKKLYFSAKVEDGMGASLTFAGAGGDLAKCLRDIMKFDKDTNIYDITLSSPTYSSVITCEINPDKLKSVTDWKDFTQSDIKSVCDAYSDCRKK
ncbi:MAG: hypothetical protein PHE09_18965 [Oscillospiraceae bacterium]|nr:hypothetical protein [Oscillospiraceae bacterium]